MRITNQQEQETCQVGMTNDTSLSKDTLIYDEIFMMALSVVLT